jgi:hypothetical protein
MSMSPEITVIIILLLATNLVLALAVGTWSWVYVSLAALFLGILIMGGLLKSPDAAQMEPKTPVPCYMVPHGERLRL